MIIDGTIQSAASLKYIGNHTARNYKEGENPHQ